MENAVKFKLMQDKPNLDIPTLNYVWDALWRFSYLAETKNERQRARKAELEHQMKFIEELANHELTMNK